MVNKYNGEVPVNIGGKAYTLVYDWNAVALIQSEYGKEAITAMLAQVQPDKMAKILLAGLNRHHPDITAEDIIKASPPILPTVEAIDTALQYAYFGPDDNKEAEGQKKKLSFIMRLLKRTASQRT